MFLWWTPLQPIVSNCIHSGWVGFAWGYLHHHWSQSNALSTVSQLVDVSTVKQLPISLLAELVISSGVHKPVLAEVANYQKCGPTVFLYILFHIGLLKTTLPGLISKHLLSFHSKPCVCQCHAYVCEWHMCIPDQRTMKKGEKRTCNYVK